jgi:TonB-linked SusC/RagA family outer membrane protein
MKRLIQITVLVTAFIVPSAAAQETQHVFVERGPRFFLASKPSPRRLDVAKTPILRQQIALDLNDVSIHEALKTIGRASGLELMYSDKLLPRSRAVTLRADAITVAAALTEVLLDADVDVLFSSSGNAALIKRAPNDRFAAGTVRGRVTDAVSGQAVSGAAVQVVGLPLAGMTSETGSYAITGVPAGNLRLTARRLGYAAQTRTVTVVEGVTATLDFALTQVPTSLSEVVTTATGPQRRREVGNVIENVPVDSLVSEAPITRLTDVLSARVAGVQLSQNTGFTGESPRVLIRGLSSMTLAREPLLFVDGVRVDNSTGALFHRTFGFLSYGHVPGRFNDINPEEIESVEIVKGPSAATLYGTDAANGVILVTTKRGRAGRAKWTVYTEAGVLSPAVSFPDNYYSWGRSTATGASQRCLLLQVAANTCTIDSLTTFSPLHDDETTIIGTGFRSQVGAQVSGGIERFGYFLSVEHERERSYMEMPSAEIERISLERGGSEIPEEQVHPNAARKISLRGNLNTSFARGELALSSGFVSGYTRIPRGNEWSSASLGSGYRDQFDGWDPTTGRPGEAFALRSAENANHYTNSLKLTLRPNTWLSTRATVGFDYSGMLYDGLQRRGEGAGATRSTGRRLSMRTASSVATVDLGATALTSFGAAMSSRTSIGAQYNRLLESITFANATGLPPGSETVTGAATVVAGEFTNESVVAGAYVEQSLGFRDRIFVTGAVRADGGSTFGKNFNTAVYPKASLSWIVLDERQAPGLSALTSLRLRAAFGAAGVQPRSIDALARVTPITSFADGALTSGAVLTAIGNPDLKPERTREFEGGVDAELFGKRVRLEATYYNKLSTDALVNRPLPSSVGILNRLENLGSVSNRGWEGLLNAVIVESPALGWDVTLNGSLNRNRLEEINADAVFITSPSNGFRVGYPIFSRWDPPIRSFSDANNNGIIERNEVVVGDTAEFIGEAHPPKQLTVATGLSFFRNLLRISSQFDYRGGFVGMNFTEINRCNSRSTCRAVNDPTAPLWDQARAVVASGPVRNWSGYMEDASFLRWREFAVTYRAPNAVARRLRTNSFSVTLSGRNLRLWSDYTSPEPEISSSAGALASEGNSDNPTAPQTRYWILRATFGF